MHWFICLLVHSGFNALENQGDGEEAYVPYLCKLLLSKDKVNSMSTITLANYAYPVHVNPRNFLGDWFERKRVHSFYKSTWDGLMELFYPKPRV